MKEKLNKLKEHLELKKANKKGALSLEAVLVTGLLVVVAVAITTMLTKTMNKGAVEANGQIEQAIGIDSQKK